MFGGRCRRYRARRGVRLRARPPYAGAMSSVLVAIAAFVAMEPITALTHRFVMHGVGWVLHRSHHDRAASRWEANDLFPVMFAGVVCTGFAVGFNVGGAGVLVPIGIGITLYGVAYALVHDLYIHGRAGGRRIGSNPVLDRLAEAHADHHRTGGAPYGMLLPVAARRPAEDIGERISTRPAP